MRLLNEMVEKSGAVIIGGRTYTSGIEEAWDNPSPFNVPVFVLFSAIPAIVRDGFTFVLDGIHTALKHGQAVAGDKNIWVMGGADTCQQFIRAGLADQLQVHIAPLLFKDGRRLFNDIGTEITGLKRLK